MRDELFAKIVLAPDDDGPRLVFADWLMENGDPERGEFIVVQCRLARGDTADNIADREAALLARHQKRWLSEVGLSKSATFARGFVESALLGYAAYLKATPKLEARGVLRTLELTKVQRDKPWSEIAGIDRLRALRIFGTYTRSMNANDMKLFDLAHLARLELPHHAIGDAGLATLLRLAALRELQVPTANIRLEGSLPAAPNLESIDLSGNDLASLEPLARAAPNLRELRLQRFIVEPKQLASFFPKLRVLHAVQAALSPARVRDLHPLALEELVAWDNPNLGEDGARAIVTAPFAANLHTLDLSAMPFGPAIAKLLASTRLPKLAHLRLAQSKLGDEGTRAIAESYLPAQLRTLRLSDNDIGEKGARAIASVEWPRLEQIEMYGSAPGAARKLLLQRFGDRLIGAR